MMSCPLFGSYRTKAAHGGCVFKKSCAWSCGITQTSTLCKDPAQEEVASVPVRTRREVQRWLIIGIEINEVCLNTRIAVSRMPHLGSTWVKRHCSVRNELPTKRTLPTTKKETPMMNGMNDDASFDFFDFFHGYLFVYFGLVGWLVWCEHHHWFFCTLFYSILLCSMALLRDTWLIEYSSALRQST